MKDAQKSSSGSLCKSQDPLEARSIVSGVTLECEAPDEVESLQELLCVSCSAYVAAFNELARPLQPHCVVHCDNDKLWCTWQFLNAACTSTTD